MATPRTLRFPPIFEALVDIQAAVLAPPEAIEALAREFQSEYPKTETKRGIHTEMRIEHGKLMPPISKDIGFQGVWLFNSDGTAIVQFRPTGFTFNNLAKYIGGDRLIGEALALWSRFSERLQPAAVTRIALRYINRLELPFQAGDEFSRFLTAAPHVPEEAPQTVTEFLSRVVVQELPSESMVIIGQRLDPQPNGPVVLIDVDTFRIGPFSTDSGELRTILDQLRALKNQTFFSLLTEDAIKLYE